MDGNALTRLIEASKRPGELAIEQVTTAIELLDSALWLLTLNQAKDTPDYAELEAIHRRLCEELSRRMAASELAQGLDMQIRSRQAADVIAPADSTQPRIL
jgi:hypothetical protein